MEKHTSKSLTKFTDPDLDSSTIAFLNESTRQIMNVVSNSATQIGKILYGAQQKLASFNNNGAFAKWIEYIGFGRTSAYNYINRYIAVQNLDSDKEIQAFESLPKSLTHDISKPSADPELTKKVLDGKIKLTKSIRRWKQSSNNVSRSFPIKMIKLPISKPSLKITAKLSWK